MKQLPQTLPAWWPLLRRTLTLLFFVAVCVLLIIQARKVEWAQVGSALREYRGATLLAAAALTAVSYLIYSCFDLIGRRYIHSNLSWRRVLSTAFVSYACNQNFGSLIGAFAFRFRLYSRFGLDNAQISRIVLLSVLTNWLGYSAVAGIVFSLRLVQLPSDWALGQNLLQLLGLLMLGVVLAYLLMCALAKRRSVQLRGETLQLPTLRMAMVQLLLSMSHWPMTAAVIYVLLQRHVGFVSVLGTLLLSSIAAVLTHIPAGIGVLEAVFVGVLGLRIPSTQLLAALLVFRAVYYLGPLMIAGLVYFGLETRAKRQDQKRSRQEHFVHIKDAH